ncbi:dienelactone hydrolase family protein [Saccharothrix syringae]|uniref:Dienelactone hydrolase n=1 Tax=Saccharothrix syringae TaxID=103733 RepID=A0A5Q0GVX7_SACSY|nr:dienelactone hydrolase family protein [Saccharothrix syringae]QFZ18168.1 dienelactone hydrolase [Saccharothrix syringae]
MTDIILFHHVQGLTPGVRAFADRLRAAGHWVATPDLFDGKTFATLEEGVAHVEGIGFDAVVQRGVDAASELPERVVYAGFSLGAMPAQRLAQTRPGALAVLLYHGAVPADTYGDSWPPDVAIQAHVNDEDDWGDLDVMRSLVEQAPDAELFTYRGSTHLFTDSGLDVYDAAATGLVVERSLALLARRA